MAESSDRVAVSLTWYELAMASQVGCRRMISALRRRLPDAHGHDGSDGWTDHVLGACGEMAFARATGRYWDGSVDTFSAGGDVGRLQVRTRSVAWYELLIRPDARPDDAYVLVRGTCPDFEVVGWCVAADAMAHPGWLKAHGGRPAAYFVPDSALRPVRELAAVAPAPAAGLASPDGRGLYPANVPRI